LNKEVGELYKVAKIWLKMILGFILSVTVMVLIVSYALSGTIATDTLEIVITEATGLQHQEVMFSTDLQPLVIVNIFWFSILVLGFCVIFLYFLDMSLKSLLAPGFLALLSVGFLQIILGVFRSFIPPEEEIAATGYVFQSLGRADQASLVVALVGIALMLFSYFGHQKLERPRKDQPKNTA